MSVWVVRYSKGYERLLNVYYEPAESAFSVPPYSIVTQDESLVRSKNEELWGDPNECDTTGCDKLATHVTNIFSGGYSANVCPDHAVDGDKLLYDKEYVHEYE